MFTQLKKLWSARSLLLYLVKADLQVSYGSKILGYLWSLLDPLMLMAVYVVVVQIIFQRGEPQYPVLLFSALLAWHWFLHSVLESASCIIRKARLLQTVAFPKIVLPVQVVLSNAVQYVFGLGALLPMLILMRAHITLYVLWVIPVFCVQFLFTLGICLIVAIVSVYFRDLPNILQFTLRMWWYLSPGLYSVSDRIPKQLEGIYMLVNPFAPLLETYKNIFVRGKPPSEYLAIVAIIALVTMWFGFWLFGHCEPALAKEV